MSARPDRFNDIVDLARTRAQEHGDRRLYTFLVDGEDEEAVFSYAHTDVRARAIAAVLAQVTEEGARALMLYPPGLEFVESFLGCLYARVIAVPAYPPDPTRLDRMVHRLKAIVADAGATVVLTTSNILSMVEFLASHAPEIAQLKWMSTDDVPDSMAEQYRAPRIQTDDLAFLQYTSGSTSTPKGVMVTHRNLLHNEWMMKATFHQGPNTIIVGWLPMYHDMGLIGNVLQPLYCQGSGVLMNPLAFLQRPFRWLRALSKYRGTTSTSPNFGYDLCVRKVSPQERATLDLSCWIHALNGAEPVRYETLRRFADLYEPHGFRWKHFYPCYGLAEGTLVVSGRQGPEPVVLPVDSAVLERGQAVEVPAELSGSRTLVGSGEVVLDERLAVVNPDTLEVCPDGVVGEVWVCGESVASGYWNMPELSARTFGARTRGGDGPFLRTGDLGFLRGGELFVTGRLKDLIIVRGRNHYPHDIELTAEQSHPALRRGCSAAFSVEVNGEEELVLVAEVDKRYRRDGVSEAELDAVVDAIRQAVVRYHDLTLHGVALIKAQTLPKTSSGKIRRQQTRSDFLDGTLELVHQVVGARRTVEREAPAPRPQGELRQARGAALTLQRWLTQELAQRLGLSPRALDVRAPFTQFGIDSKEAVGLSGELERLLRRRVSPTLLYEFPNIQDLAAHLAESAPDVGLLEEVEGEPEGEAIAIVGIGCRLPGASGPQAVWELLREGRDAVREVPAERWDIDAWYDPDPATPGKVSTRWGGFIDQVDRFDARFFQVSPREALRLDPQQRLLMEVAWEALHDAGIAPERLRGRRAGVFVGIASNDYGQLQTADPEQADAYIGTGNALSIAANRLSYFFDLRGPSLAVDTACSSSLVAVHLACQALRSGEAELALAGGVNLLLTPTVTISFSKGGFMAPDGRCKTFDADANGYVRGEGAGLLVLKPLSRAKADGDPIYAVIRGSAVNQDGRTNGLTAPSRAAQEEVLREACRRAGVAPSRVGYVEAHGTGTALGDPIEARALGAVYGARRQGAPLLVGSIKTNIGHLEAAAGVAGLIKVALSLRNGLVPPSLHFQRPNPLIPFEELGLQVAARPTPWPAEGPRLAGVSSFGFGGTNAHILLQAADGPEPARARPERSQLLPLSAPRPEALRELAQAWLDRLAFLPAMADVAYTAGARTAQLDHRLALVARKHQDLGERLEAWLKGESRAGLVAGRVNPDRASRLAFVFPGQGGQWPGMARALFEQEPAFRQAMEACAEAIAPHVRWNLIEHVTAAPTDTPDPIDVVQPTLWAVQVSLAALWRHWGIEPDAVVGHSMGEVAAACVAGALSLADGARIICRRSRLMRRLSGRGAMAVVELGLDQARAALAGREQLLSVAVNNSPRSTVISGDPAALDALLAELEAREVFCRRVNVDVASHSPQMDELRADLLHALAPVRPTAGRVPIYSTVEDARVDGSGLGAAYWARNLREPVLFASRIHALIEEGFDLFVELSPHPVLGAAVQQNLTAAQAEGAVLTSMRRSEDGREVMLEALGALYTRGWPVDFSRLVPEGGQVVPLPTFGWRRERFWSDAPPSRRKAPRGAHPLLGEARPLSTPPGSRVFEAELALAELPWLGEHRVQGAVVLPAAAMVELALAAGQQLGGAWAADRVRFEQTLVLPDQGSRALQLVLSAEPEGYDFRLSSREPGAEEWTLHAVGILVPHRAHAQPDLAAAQARCTTPADRDALYRRLAEAGLEYGPTFQGIQSLARGEGEALAQVTPPAAAGPYVLHPALLDACFQVLSAAMDSGEGPVATWLPVGLTHLGLAAPETRAAGPLWVHARASGGEGREQSGDLWVLDAAGQLVAELGGLRVRRLDSGEARVQDLLYSLRWVQAPAPAPAGTRPEGAWVMLLDHARAGQALRARLLEAGDRVVRVVPGERTRLVEHDLYQVDKHRPEGFADLMRLAFGSASVPCRGVLHMWSLDEDTPPSDSLERPRRRVTLAALHLVQALSRGAQAQPPRLWLITNGAQPALPGEGAAPWRSALWGLGRVITNEHPELRCTLVDLPATPGEADVEALLAELLLDSPERQLAFRGGQRLAARLDRAAEEPVPEAQLHPAGARPYRLEIERPGSLERLRLRELAPAPPGPGEVRVRVQAAALNFLDVLTALGVRPDLPPDQPARLGLECAGVIEAVGDGVVGLALGQRVCAFAPNSLATHVTTPAVFVAPWPEGFTADQAASAPTVFMTAHYALSHLARLQAGERVLIHAGAGGVGLAAIQLAQAVGAEVFATAGSEAKRAFLRELGVPHVLDSRSLAFAEQVRALTGGRGVDVVLNSLAGEFLTASLETLAPYGRFVEIGKRDIYQDSPVGLAPFRRNLSFFAVDLARMAEERPERVGALLREVMAALSAGTWRPVPTRVFPASQAQEAFEIMARAWHIGKVVVALDDAEAPIARAGGSALRPDRAYLITGGLGGLGLVVAEWLLSRGARHLALLGRRPPDEATWRVLDGFTARGAQVQVLQADVTDARSLGEALARVSVPLGGVVHAAGVLDDAVLANQDVERFQRVLGPKENGAWNLHRLTAGMDLDLFVLFSSAAAVFGSPGQGNYAAGNAFLDGLAQLRRAQGLPATSIAWGPWAEVGLAAASAQRGERLGQRGLSPLSQVQGLRALEAVLDHQRTHTAVLDWDFARWRRSFGEAAEAPLYELLRARAGGAPEAGTGAAAALRQRLLELPAEERLAQLKEDLVGEVARVLRTDPRQVDEREPLKGMGLDSMMAVELRSRIQADLGVNVSVVKFLRGLTVSQLAADVLSELGAEAPPEPAAPAASAGWVQRPQPRPDARLRLFCFASAGGGAEAFDAWGAALPEWVEVCAVQLPGRGDRLTEPAHRELGPLVAAVAEGLRPYLDRPFALFGHSMGGLVAFELARQLRAQGGPTPLHVFAAAIAAPQDMARLPKLSEDPVHELPRARLVEALRFLNYRISPEMMADEELWRALEPAVRGDFAVIASYRYQEQAPLGVPLTVFAGQSDRFATLELVRGWERQTRAAFALHPRPGDHFFLDADLPFLLGEITRALGG